MIDQLIGKVFLIMAGGEHILSCSDSHVHVLVLLQLQVDYLWTTVTLLTLALYELCRKNMSFAHK